MTVLSFETARQRRDLRSGEPLLVLEAVERALDDPLRRDEAVESFYAVFWVALEDEALSDRVGALDLRIGRKA